MQPQQPYDQNNQQMGPAQPWQPQVVAPTQAGQFMQPVKSPSADEPLDIWQQAAAGQAASPAQQPVVEPYPAMQPQSLSQPTPSVQTAESIESQYRHPAVQPWQPPTASPAQGPANATTQTTAQPSVATHPTFQDIQTAPQQQFQAPTQPLQPGIASQPQTPAQYAQPMSYQANTAPTQQPAGYPATSTPYMAQPQLGQPAAGSQSAYTNPVNPAIPNSTGYGQTQPYPQAGQGIQFPVNPNANGRKYMYIAIAVVVVLLLLTAAAMLFMSNKNNGLSGDSSNSANTAKDVVSRSDGTLDMSNLINSQSTIKNQTLQAGTNQQLNLSDGYSYMVTSVQHNYSGKTTYLQPQNGKEIIKVSVVAGNRNKSGNVYFSSSYFKLKNSAGGIQNAVFATKEDDAETLEGLDAFPGKQIKGAVFFETDKNEAVTLVTNEQYKNYTTNKTVTVASEVKL